MEPLMRDDLVERRQRRAGGERSAQQAAPAQPEAALVVRLVLRLSIVHKQDFDTSKRRQVRSPKIRA